MKRLFLCYILIIFAFTLSSCDLDLEQYCFHMYPETYEYNDDEHYLTCNLCKNKEIEKHIYDDGDIIDEPTEESEGVIRFSCEICDYYYDEEIPKNVHKHTYESKWSNDDLYHWLDASCGHDVIDKKGIHSGGTATCKELAICEVCKVSYGDLLEHKFENYVYNNDATLDKDGTETAECIYGCGTSDTKVAEGTKLEHEHVFNVKNTWIINNISGATCQQKARYYYMCECGEVGTEIFEDGELADHIFSNYVYNNDATETEDGTETAYCNYGCGETDTRTKEGSKLNHVHVFDVENVSTDTYASGATCQAPEKYFYSCVCGEIGEDTFEYGEPSDHNYNTPNYFWVNDNLSVTAIAMCSVCNTPLTETVGTTYSVVVEPTEKENGVGRYTTLPFINNNVFNQQFKDVVIKAVVSVLSGNSTYGYNDLLNLENGENMQDFYEKLYSISSEFMSSSENMIIDANGLYTLDTIDVSEFGLTFDEALAVWKIFYLENPSFYWLSNTVSSLGNSLILAIDEAYASASYRAECDEDIMTMISDCETYLSSATTDSEKAKLIHDFIINRIDYAYKSDGITPEEDIWAHNIMGAASHEFGVCETYAKTYLFLALLNDVESIIVSGMANGGAHAWNYICIDEKWYGVDATWDDQSYGIIYNYFGTSKSGIADHTPDSNTVMNFDYLYALPELSETGLSVL